MDGRKMKVVAEWLRNTVFTDEAIQPRAPQRPVQRLPAMLRTARSLELGGSIWQSRESVFLKQAKLLVNYEDDYEFQGTVRCYYPTYQSLTDLELRGYFSWRTRLRRGEVQKTSLSFAFLYIYELINQIGVETPREGYDRLRDFQDVYGRLDGGILSYLNCWLADYVIYYGLDPALLADSPQVLRDRSITVLDHIQEEASDQIAAAVKCLSPKWLGRSKFYAANAEDMDAVIVRVLRRVSAHYAARCKKTMVEQYFGSFAQGTVRPFESAVFTDPLKRRKYEYAVDEQCIYRCENGCWSVWKRTAAPGAARKLDGILKTIDARMREAYGDHHPVKAELDTKWIIKIIEEEIQALLAEKKAAEEQKITINYAQLTRIRQDAAVTREKLIVDEELDEPAPPAPPEPAPVPAPAPAAPADCPLDPAEYRLMQCLLYGGDTGWVQAEGRLLSVLVDGINEKLYDTFFDTVLDDASQVIEDYMEDLKEMVRP